MKSLSPLRYPGGKAKVYNRVVDFFKLNKLSSITYVEPFAGGCGLALLLLKNNIVKACQSFLQKTDRPKT